MNFKRMPLFRLKDGNCQLILGRRPFEKLRDRKMKLFVVLVEAHGPQGEGYGPQEDELSGGFACPGGGGGCGGCGGGASGPLAPAVELLLDCQAVIAAQIGQNMRRQFERNAISVFDIELQVSEALEKLAAYYSKLGV